MCGAILAVTGCKKSTSDKLVWTYSGLTNTNPTKIYHLVETQMLDADISGSPLTVYVLLFPDDTRPKVFKTFDSKEMEAWLSSLPRDSVVHYEANGFSPRVDSTKLEALKTCCQKKGVSLSEGMVN